MIPNLAKIEQTIDALLSRLDKLTLEIQVNNRLLERNARRCCDHDALCVERDCA